MRHGGYWFGLLLVSLPTLGLSAPMSVTEAWQAAREHDPAYAAALAQIDADRARGSQARALWLPSLSAVGSSGRGSAETVATGAAFSAPGFGSTNGVDFRTSINGGTATRWAVAAEQPLFSADRLAQSREMRNAARAGEINFRLAEQDLLLRTTQTYFAVITAERSVQALQAQAEAAARARTEADERYRAGDIAVTDLREAEAVADSLAFQLVAARNRAELARNALADLTGAEQPQVATGPSQTAAEAPSQRPLEAWLERVQQTSPQLAVQRLLRGDAAAERARYALPFSPVVSLVGQAGRETLRGDGDFGAASSTSQLSSVALQVAVPLFTGGWRSARLRETRALDQKAAAELVLVTQQTLQQARAAWLGAATAAARVSAAFRAEASAASRLAATRVGKQAGDRSTLDLLTAEGAALQATTERIQAQLDQLLAQLQLAAATGELTAEQLKAIDQSLF
jgi:outer membrane protein